MVTRWRMRTVVFDLIKALAGFTLMAWGSLMFPLLSLWQIFFLPLCGLLLAYCVSCALKLVSTISLTEDGLEVNRRFLGTKRITWKEVTSIEVRSFPMSALKRTHISDAKIKTRTQVVLLDDSLEQFPDVMQMTWNAATRHGLDISALSRVNLKALGCTPPMAG